MEIGPIVLVYLSILVFIVSPFISVAISSAIASAAGAQLDEGSAHPCIIWGIDIGPMLYAMFVAGWFFLVTIPLGVLAALAFTMYLVLS